MGASGLVRKLTKLEAVNIILRGAREHPVSSLDEDNTNESLLALQILNEWLLQIQAIGLFNNTFERDFVPSTVTTTSIAIGDIVLPPNTLYATPWGQQMRFLADGREDNGLLKLYDLENETFDFSACSSVTIRFVLCLEFADLSAIQQRAIADQAAHEYQMSVLGSQSMNLMLQQRANRSRAESRAENIRKMRPNHANNFRSNIGRSNKTTLRPWWTESDGRQVNRRL